MMTKADDIEHLCRMISSHIDNLRVILQDEAWGYLNRLEKVIDSGGFATQETEEELKLKRGAAELRELADRIDKTRVRLMLNERRHHVGAER